MPRDQVLAMVNGYLHDWEEVSFERSEDGGTFRLVYGSTAVYVTCYEVDSTTVVQLEAPVLTGLKEDAPLERLATMNAVVAFGKFCYHPDVASITVEHELLGDFLDAAELYTAIQQVGSTADEWDERLKQDFGGELHSAEGGGTEERDV